MATEFTPFKFHFFRCAGSKLTGNFLLITLFVLATSVYISLEISRSHFEDVVKSQFKSALNVHENFIEHSFEFSESWAEHMAREPKLRRAFRYEDAALRKRFLTEHEPVIFADTFVMLLGKDAILLYCSSGEHQEKVLWQHEVIRKVFSSLKTHSAIINDNGHFSFVSAAPVFISEQDRTLLGVVVVGKKITHQFAQQIQKNAQIDLAIVGDRAIMATTLKAADGRHLFELPIHHVEYLELLKHPGKTLELTISGKKYFVAAKKIARMDNNSSGSIMLLKPGLELELIEHRLLKKFLFLALAAFLLILLVSVRIARTFMEPVHQLIQTTYRIAQGESGLRVNISHLKDDFSLLAKNFNFMIWQIEEKNRQIQRHNAELEDKVQERTQELKKLTVAVEQSPSSIVITDLDGNLQYVNPRFTKVTGYTQEEVLGENPRILHSGLTPQETYAELWETLTRGDIWRGEFINQRKNGEHYWEHAVIAPIRNELGNIIHYVGIKEDITDYKKVEEQNTRLGRVLEDSLNEIYIFDAHTLHFTQVNKGARHNLGYSMKELAKLTPQDLKPEYTREQFESLIAPLRTGEKPYLLFKTCHQRKDGSTYPVEVHLQHAKAETSSMFVAIIQDISERCKAEEMLKQAKTAAEQASFAKSQFVANMSHELRTPLNAILGFSQIMARQENLTDSQQHYMQVINHSGEHLLTLINEVLDISKIEAGELTLRLSDFHLPQLLEELEILFQERLQRKHLMLDIEYKKPFDECIRSDKTKCRQILVNLIGNAIKFTDAGKITIRVDYRTLDEKKLNICIEIEDTGKGIADKDLQRIFDNFIQAENSEGASEGTGLGLAITHKFIALMNGTIEVKSQIGKGSVFRFNIQVEKGSCSQPVHGEKKDVLSLVPGQPPCRILIVDNLETNRLLLHSQLAPLGFELQEAENGQQAIDIWREWQPHLIFMDMRMPVMDGYQATAEIRRQAQDKVAIIALTASVFEDKQQKTFEVGCDDFIGKPFKPEELLEKIHEHAGVKFIYREEGNLQKADMDITGAALMALPDDLRNGLAEALKCIDTEALEALLEKIGQQNRALATAIRKQLDDFRHQTLLDLLTTQKE